MPHSHPLTSSVEGSPASQLAMLASEPEPLTAAGSGLKCYESSLVPHLGTSWQKTCTALLLTSPALSSKLCTLTWTQRVTKQRRLSYFRLLPSVPHIAGIGSGFLPTPDTTGGAPNLGSNKRNGPKSLIEAARMWSTPTVRDAGTIAKARRGGGFTGEGDQLVEPLVVQAGGTLNPPWVEWLMGFPIGWTDLGDLETPLSPSAPNTSGEH